MTSPISRTRGFLFADLRGYSAYTDRHGDRAAEALIGRYRRLVRTHIAAFDGAEIRTEGDSFYVVFDSVAEAVEAALAISGAAREAGEEAPIPVGIGVHAGESRDGEDGIVSSAVNIAARVCSVAPAGQVLVTDTVRSLVRTALPVRFTPVGRRRLKGIAELVQLFVVSPPAGESDHVSATPGSWRTKRRYVVSLLAALLLAVGAIVAAVWLWAGTSPERTASTDRATPSSSTPSAPATPQSLLGKGPLSAGTYATAEFQPAFSLSVDDGWADAIDTPDDFYIVRVASPRGAMGAFRTNVVFSGPCRNSPTQRIEGGSESMLTWLEQHPYLESMNPRPRIVDGITGIQIDVTARELPQPCPDGSRHVHLIPLAGTDGVSIAPDQEMRFVVADLPGGTVTFDFTAPADFQQFLVEADAVLDTVDFVDPGG